MSTETKITLTPEQKARANTALETLGFWAMCFDYPNYVCAKPMYGGADGCRDAEYFLRELLGLDEET